MLDYIRESWKIFLTNINEIGTGYKGAMALIFLFSVFLTFYNISKGFKDKKE